VHLSDLLKVLPLTYSTPESSTAFIACVPEMSCSGSSRPQWATFQIQDCNVRIAFLEVAGRKRVLWTFRDVMEKIEGNRKPCKAWSTTADNWIHASKLFGDDPLALQMPYRTGTQRHGQEPAEAGEVRVGVAEAEGDPSAPSRWFPDLVVSSGIMLAYLLQKASQRIAVFYRLESKLNAQLLCIGIVNEALRNCDLNIAPGLAYALPEDAMIDAREVVRAAVYENCCARSASETFNAGWGWLCSRWESKRRCSSGPQAAMIDRCCIGTAIVFLFEEFSFQVLVRSMNVSVSLAATAVQALEYKASLLETSMYQENVEEYKTATGKRQAGTFILQVTCGDLSN